MGILGHLFLKEQRCDANAAGDQADCREDQREEDTFAQKIIGHAQALSRRTQEHMVGQNDAGGDGSNIAFQQVRAKAGHVAHVVAHIVGNGGGVAGIVLGNMCLGLTYQVSAHVRGLGIDTTADTVEHGDHGAAQGIAGESHGKGDELQAQQVFDRRLGDIQLLQPDAEDHVDQKQAQHCKAADAQAHDRAAAESDLDGLADILGLPRTVGHAHVGVGGDLHAHKSGRGGHDGADDERHRSVPGGHDRQDHSHDEDNDEQHPVLIIDERVGTDTNGRGDLTHPLGALGHLFHAKEVECGKSQRQHGGKDDQNNKYIHFF